MVSQGARDSYTKNPFSGVGAFWSPSFTDGTLHMGAGTDKGLYDGIGFSAKRSNTLYGATSRVSVPACYALIIIKA